MFRRDNKHFFFFFFAKRNDELQRNYWFVFFINGRLFVCCYFFFVWLCFCFREKGRELIGRKSLHSHVFSYEGELERKMM